MGELSAAHEERVDQAFTKAVTDFLTITQLLAFSFTFASQADEALRQEVGRLIDPLETL